MWIRFLSVCATPYSITCICKHSHVSCFILNFEISGNLFSFIIVRYLVAHFEKFVQILIPMELLYRQFFSVCPTLGVWAVTESINISKHREMRISILTLKILTLQILDYMIVL